MSLHLSPCRRVLASSLVASLHSTTRVLNSLLAALFFSYKELVLFAVQSSPEEIHCIWIRIRILIFAPNLDPDPNSYMINFEQNVELFFILFIL